MVKEPKVKVGDKVAEGSVVLLIEAAGEAGGKAVSNTVDNAPVTEVSGRSEEKQAVALVGVSYSAISNIATLPSPSGPIGAGTSVPNAASFSGTVDLDCDLLVLGAGPGGYSAAILRRFALPT